MFTQEQIRKEYDYDKDLGELVRKNCQKRRDPASRKSRYNNVKVNGKPIREHRAIWIWHYGEIPDGLVLDHIDGNTHNNRIENLRLSTKSQNGHNRGPAKNNKTGFKGVSVRKDGRYEANIYLNRKGMRLGIFDNTVDAAKAYDDAALMYLGDFSKTNKQMGLI